MNISVYTGRVETFVVMKENKIVAGCLSADPIDDNWCYKHEKPHRNNFYGDKNVLRALKNIDQSLDKLFEDIYN